MGEEFEEKYKKDPEHYNKKIFGKQKVKLYYFNFIGNIVENF